MVYHYLANETQPHDVCTPSSCVVIAAVLHIIRQTVQIIDSFYIIIFKRREKTNVYFYYSL